MRILVGFLLVLTPALVHAKSYNDGKGGTWDCKTDSTITINANGGTYVFSGECKVITVNGNKNTITVDKVSTITVNGNSNSVTATTLDVGTANGNDNKITYKTGTPTTTGSNGRHNTIEKAK